MGLPPVQQSGRKLRRSPPGTGAPAGRSAKVRGGLDGGDPSIPIALPWIALFNGAIYGEADTPHSCYFNSGPEGATSSPFFQTAAVAPGEVDDRYRNHGPGQGIGYSMFTLERIVDTAEVLRIAGFDPYAYRGRRKQSIEMAMEYYACFGKAAGFGGTVTAENSRSCQDAAQYVGKIVNGVDQMVTIGAYRYPRNATIGALAAAAKLSSSGGAFSLDAILFGKWSD
jgi:hypothetical protein